MASELDTTVASADVVVFSTRGCPFCRQVKKGLESQGVAFTEVSFDGLAEGDAVRSEIRSRHKATSVPAVFVKGKFVGGCNDGPEPWMGALKLLANGGLQEMLNSKL
jgi:glutaredoxin 3|tara:strand:- start:2720 stop:3040 length:321 start_codon:yes stop_codon:yes gene_type:complete